MPVITLEEGNGETEEGGYGEWEPIPAGEIVTLEVTEVNYGKEMPWKDRETGAAVYRTDFKFTVLDEPWTGRTVYGNTPTTFTDNENCKLRNWVQEIFGAELPAGFQLNTDDLIGEQVRGRISQYQSKKGTPDEKTRNGVEDLMRVVEAGSPYSAVDDEAPF